MVRGTGEPETSLMQIEVRPATVEEEPVLANLLELYTYDFSEFLNLKVGDDGRFGYGPLPLYWEDANRFPFLIRVNGDLAGFVLVQKGLQVSSAADVWDVAEFFVLRGFRRHGVGLRVAHELWRMFAGRWEVRVMENNSMARTFWRRAVSEFIGTPAEPALMEVSEKRWHVFSFISARQADV